MSLNQKSTGLAEFVTWVTAHIHGDEKGEAQIYLDRLFKGFGHAGLKEAGATCEERVKNDTGGTSFADLVWKPRVVIEMKKRGSDLNKHYSQAFTYWTYLVPNRPRYAVLCNFDEFWVYDFETQMDTAVEKINLVDLPERYGAVSFLFPGDVAPVFGNHHEAVTREAAKKLATCFNLMVKRGVDRALAQRFILQILMAFFAEDINLLEKYLVKRLLDECKSTADTYDIVGGLFEAMNRKEGNQGGRYKGVAYFNGGLFASPAKVELVAEELGLLKESCDFNWSRIRPEIFGTLFERSLGKEERHATGAHFTSPVDIMKIVGPTIVEPWREAIERTKTLTEMQALVHRMNTFTVLDPACGSGNFLFIAYREMKRLEAALYTRMAERFPKSVDPNQRTLGFVTTTNFFGMDINPFAVEIAKVTMMLAHKLSIDELHVNESALPLDNLDSNILHRDALITATGAVSEWPTTDVIIGNPPFLGAKLLKPELGKEYVEKVRSAFPEVPGMADLCVYWIRRAHDQLNSCTQMDRLGGRAGLVGTQNIRSNQSRVGGLDHVAATGTIIEAVDNQPWSGEANVSVSIANWVKSQDASLLPATRRLWFKSTLPAKGRRGSGPSSKVYDLDMREAGYINASLSDGVDVAAAVVLPCNTTPQRVFQGQTPGHKGFMLTPSDRDVLLATDPSSSPVLHEFIGGNEVLCGATLPARFVIDFEQKSIVDASKHAAAFRRVKATVLPARQEAAEEDLDLEGQGRSHHEAFLSHWWQLSWGRADLLESIRNLPRYLVCSRITKRPLFAFVRSAVRPGDSLQVFAFADDYSFGVLQGIPHQLWFVAKGSKLTERLRYTPESVFDTFPWPQNPSNSDVGKVAVAAVELRHVQRTLMSGMLGGLRMLYRTFELPGKNPLKDAHAALDKAVLNAYGFSAKKDLLQQLLSLNGQVSANLKAGSPVTVPGIPPGFPNPAILLSEDCL